MKNLNKKGISILNSVSVFVLIVLLAAAVLTAACYAEASSEENGGTAHLEPLFEGGMAQSVFPADSIVRYCVWVETDNDTDADGRKDLVMARVQLPRPAMEGYYKAAVLFEGDPTAAESGDGESGYPSRYDYFLERGFAVVTSAGPGTLGSDGYVTVGSREEADAFAAVVEWIHGDRKAYTDRSRKETVSADWSNDPALYHVRAGHKLVLYIFPYDLGRISFRSPVEKLSSSFIHKLQCEYAFTINRRSRFVAVLEGEKNEPGAVIDPSEYELKDTKKLIIDSDTAGDDAMAIMMAAKCPQIDLLGVTVLPGNVDMQQALANALMTLEVAKCDAPVYAGSETFLTGEVPSTFSIFGKDGMGDSDIIHPTRKAEEGSGIDFIIDTVRENPGEVEIVELGPCTNLALAIRKAPDVMKNVKKIWIMGSAGQGVGNATPVAEFNVYTDAEAVKVVLESGIPAVFVGWDLALDNRTYFYYDDMLRLADTSEEGKFMVKALSKLAENKLLQYGEYYIDLADPIAMAACIWPDYITSYKSCYAYCCADTENMPVYGQVVFYDKDKTYDAKFEIPPANCVLSSSQKADEFVERIIELLSR